MPPERAWEIVRHVDMGRSRLARALFAARTLPGRLTGERPEPPTLLLSNFASSPERPGFQILVDDPPREVVVGAIGKVWQPDIPFVHVASPAAFILEYSLGANPLLHELAKERFEVKDGRIAAPERPGLGLTIRDDFVQKYAV